MLNLLTLVFFFCCRCFYSLCFFFDFFNIFKKIHKFKKNKFAVRLNTSLVFTFYYFDFFGLSFSYSFYSLFKSLLFFFFSGNSLYINSFLSFFYSNFLKHFLNSSFFFFNGLSLIKRFSFYCLFNSIYTKFILKLSFLSFKFKNHGHHIVPSYFSQNHYGSSSFNKDFFKNFNFLDLFLSSLPYYFILVVSIASLFILFFIFLHENILITNFFSFSLVSFKNLIFYISLIFYIFCLIYSFFKFFIHIQEEISCTYIYTKRVEQQYLFGIILFIISEIMLFFSFF